MKIQVLDCTLRDGGYVNNWVFEKATALNIYDKLESSEVNIIECGLLSETRQDNDNNTIFSSINSILNFFGSMKKKDPKRIVLTNLGEFSAKNLPINQKNVISGIRVAFRKDQMEEAIDFSKECIKKGYEIYLQPMQAISYSDQEIVELLKLVNKIDVYAFGIVDSFGTMRQKDLIRLFNIVEGGLNKNIAIDFHSHNNLQLSFSLAQVLLQQKTERKIIIDSSIFGMGRGAGNLCTELLINHLNIEFHKTYQIIPILEAIEEYVNPIFKKNPWGYSVPYYIASINDCHPDYCTYLLGKQTLGVLDIQNIISRIPNEKKKSFDKEYMETQYILYQTKSIEDCYALKKLKKCLNEDNILILAPGKTISSHRFEHTLQDFIADKNPIIFTTNFVTKEIPADIAFVTNAKIASPVFEDLKNSVIGDPFCIFTSNIQAAPTKNFFKVDYGGLLGKEPGAADNSVLMLLSLLEKLEKKEVYLAGFDGFSPNNLDNYFTLEKNRGSIDFEALNNRNMAIAQELKRKQETMIIHFLTPSLYPNLVEKE